MCLAWLLARLRTEYYFETTTTNFGGVNSVRFDNKCAVSNCPDSIWNKRIRLISGKYALEGRRIGSTLDKRSDGIYDT